MWSKTKKQRLQQRQINYPFPKCEACSHCVKCLDPSRNQACVVKRQHMPAVLEERRAYASHSIEPSIEQKLEAV